MLHQVSNWFQDDEIIKLGMAIRAAKRMMRHAMTEDFEDHVQRQYLALLPLFASKDFREGLASYLERRTPEFTGE